MKNILLWDALIPNSPPVRILVDDAVASAAVRAGVAVPVNASDYPDLVNGAALSRDNPVIAALQVVVPAGTFRVRLPRSVLNVAVQLGLAQASDPNSVAVSSLPILLPTGFILPSGVFPFTLWRDPLGVAHTDFVRETWAPTPDLLPSEARATFFVDAARSTDTGDGLSWDNAKRTINSAVQLGNAQPLPFVIFVRAGVYDRGMCPTGAGGATVPNKTCALIAVGGRVETGFFDQVTWMLDQGTTYRATRNSVRRVVNLAAPNSRSVYPDLTWVSSLDACRTTPGSWYTDNITVYVNRSDGAAVTTANTRVFLTLPQSPLRMSTGGNMYVAGFDFQGNTPALIDGGIGHRFVGEDCSFRYSSGDDGIVTPAAANHKDGIVIAGVNGAALIRCDASANQKDGINWRASNGGTNNPFVLTIDCTAFNNGRPNAISCNGLTAHDGCSGIDIRGRYERNAGGQVAIVHAGTMLWCIDTACRSGRGDVIYGGAVPPTDFLVDQDTPTLWLDNCRSSETQISVYARTGRILTRGGSFGGETYTANGGTVETYV